MSSNNLQSLDSQAIKSLDFNSQFTEINGLLDKVIERNSKVVDLAHKQGIHGFSSNQYSSIEAPIVQFINNQSPQKTSELTIHNPSFLSPGMPKNLTIIQFY